MRSSRRLIGIAALVSFGTITLAELQREQRLPTTDQWLGFMIAFFLISALSDLGVKVAGGFATLTMVAVLLTRGDDALAFAMQSTDREQKKNRRRKRRRRLGSLREGERPEGGGDTIDARPQPLSIV